MTVKIETDYWIDEQTLREHLAVEGWDFFAAADHFDTTEVDVKLHVKHYDIEPTWKDEDVMARLVKSCDSMAEVGREIGLSRKGARYWIEQHGLPTPSPTLKGPDYNLGHRVTALDWLWGDRYGEMWYWHREKVRADYPELFEDPTFLTNY